MSARPPKHPLWRYGITDKNGAWMVGPASSVRRVLQIMDGFGAAGVRSSVQFQRRRRHR